MERYTQTYERIAKWVLKYELLDKTEKCIQAIVHIKNLNLIGQYKRWIDLKHKIWKVKNWKSYIKV